MRCFSLCTVLDVPDITVACAVTPAIAKNPPDFGPTGLIIILGFISLFSVRVVFPLDIMCMQVLMSLVASWLLEVILIQLHHLLVFM